MNKDLEQFLALNDVTCCYYCYYYYWNIVVVMGKVKLSLFMTVN